MTGTIWTPWRWTAWAPAPAFPGRAEGGLSFLPVWVADMNFATVPTIAQAIAKRIEHPLFGYFRPSQAYFDAIINWQRTQNGVEGLLPGAYRL